MCCMNNISNLESSSELTKLSSYILEICKYFGNPEPWAPLLWDDQTVAKQQTQRHLAQQLHWNNKATHTENTGGEKNPKSLNILSPS